MSDDQFTKLFKYMQHMREDMLQLEARLSSRIDSVYSLLDAHIKQRETDEQERQALTAQLAAGTELKPQP